MRTWIASLLGLGLVAACGAGSPPAAPQRPASSAPAPVASAIEPPDDPLPALRTGAIAPVEDATVRELTVAMRHVAHGYESIAAVLPQELSSRGAVVSVDSTGGPAPWSFAAPLPWGSSLRRGGATSCVWIRRPVSTADVTGDLFEASTGDRPGTHVRFHVASPGSHPSEAAALPAYLRALADQFSDSAAMCPSCLSATARLNRIADALDVDKKKKPTKAAAGRSAKAPPVPRARPRPTPPRTSDVAGFLESTTGLAAVQEALQHDRGLWTAASDHQRSVPVTALSLPPLKHHPWSTMLAKLPAPPPEPLAADVPAEFYYLRSRDLGSLLSLLDELDSWATAAREVLREAVQDKDLAGRYETQLALRRGPLTRALGPAVVGQVAVVGSDPYVDAGSDLTLLFQVKNGALFDAALAATQADLEKDNGALSHETRDHGGVSVQVTSGGAVRQQRATIGDLALVSNSPHAIDAVIDAIQGKRARLADEPDFRFMLARDAGALSDVLAFLGDRFVAEAVGPKQKILETRREYALGDFEELATASLLYGLVQGRSPKKVDELLSAGLVAPEELAHADGEAIAFAPGSAPRSSWGAPVALTPLIDLPPVDRVSPGEKTAYERFAQGYQSDWASYIDPVAVRFDLGDADARGRRHLRASLRELPLLDRTQYSDFVDLVGASRFAAQPALGGVRLLAGLAHDSDVRKDLSRTLGQLSGEKLALDWVGEWAAVGVADRTSIATALLRLAGDKLPQKPSADDHEDDDFSSVAKLPLYAEIGVRSAAQVAIALAAARVVADSTIPGMFDWGEAERYRDVPIVRVALKGDAAKDLTGSGELEVYYAVAQGALVVSLKEWLMKRLIDERLDGRGPDAAARADAGAAGPGGTEQVAFDLGTDPGKGLWAAIAWLMEEELTEWGGHGSEQQARMLLFGAPEVSGDAASMRSLALAYFGAAPLTPDGAPYALARGGVADPARGTAFAPSWPDLPVAGSPLDRILRVVASLHSAVAFDDEGKDGDHAMRSLHATMDFALRP